MELQHANHQGSGWQQPTCIRPAIQRQQHLTGKSGSGWEQTAPGPSGARPGRASPRQFRGPLAFARLKMQDTNTGLRRRSPSSAANAGGAGGMARLKPKQVMAQRHWLPDDSKESTNFTNAARGMLTSRSGSPGFKRMVSWHCRLISPSSLVVCPDIKQPGGHLH